MPLTPQEAYNQERKRIARLKILDKVPDAAKYIHLIVLEPVDNTFVVNTYNVSDKTLAAQIESVDLS